jgi:hypothetical protein
MVVVRTEGDIHGEHQEGDGVPMELHGPWLLETDDEAGTVKTRTKRRNQEFRGTRLAMSAQLLQRVYAEDMKAEEYAKTPPRAVPKPQNGKRSQSRPKVPEGYVVCPGCSTGMTDPTDCPMCESNGIVRADEDRNTDESA